ncbi:MAG: HAD family hydrolase [Candidatus Binataceae bacterium]
MIRAIIFDLEGTLFDGDRLYPGAAEFVRKCAERFPLMLATGAARHDAEDRLRHANLRDAFVDVLGAEDAERAKPAPDLFVATLGRIGFLLRQRDPVEPSQCLAIEDSIAGVEAAHRAGMFVLALAHTRACAALEAADFVRRSFAEVDLDAILRICAT